MKPESSKKSYETPEAEVIRFDVEDVITASKASDTRMPAVQGSSTFNLY